MKSKNRYLWNFLKTLKIATLMNNDSAIGNTVRKNT